MNAEVLPHAEAADVVAQKTRRVLFTAVRNEAIFLLEWLAYHKAIGFTDVIVFANPSDDGTDELLQALDEAGEIELHPNEIGDSMSAQASAAEVANETGLLRDNDWVLWLDADEFLVVNVGGRQLADLINFIGDRKGMLIPWRIFGDGGNRRFPGRFVSGDFVKASRRFFNGNREHKSIFRHGPWIAGLPTKGPHRPTIRKSAGLKHDDFIAGSGKALDAKHPFHKKWLNGFESFTAYHSVADQGFSYAQINHYVVRTREHFALKSRRGRGTDAAQTGQKNLRHTPDFFRKVNRNDVEDRKILRHKPAVDAGVARLLDIPTVRDAYHAAVQKTEKLVATLPEDMLTALDVAAGDFKPDETTTAAFQLTLPSAAADAVRTAYAEANSVLEYGSGGSTVLGAELGVPHLFSVESDKGWSDRLGKALDKDFPDHTCRMHYADIGPTKEWGRPDGNSGFARYHGYAMSVWDREDFVPPDVVLIDGRFRVACFLTTLMRCQGKVTVLFDDYRGRPEYHWIEALTAPVDFVDRMAVFKVERTSIPDELVTKVVGAYVDPR